MMDSLLNLGLANAFVLRAVNEVGCDNEKYQRAIILAVYSCCVGQLCLCLSV